MPLHFRDGGRERVASGQGGRGRVQACLRSGGGGRGGSPRPRLGGGLYGMSSYDMVRLRDEGDVAGLPGNCADIGEFHEIGWVSSNV
ncbi:hypothetical protein CFB84_12550 [Burkholderia aenigmatica]|uniref:Uncharacterized protein n=1 Tax=Burkholderia aenigmatica TaxID=2015348 RepID=A0A228IYP0_9BURK|nr:hypothetical protein CFB84_12550 [Burkholderia aenigmatica]